MFSVFCCEWNVGLLDLQITAFCFCSHFTQDPNFFGIGVVVGNFKYLFFNLFIFVCLFVYKIGDGKVSSTSSQQMEDEWRHNDPPEFVSAQTVATLHFILILQHCVTLCWLFRIENGFMCINILFLIIAVITQRSWPWRPRTSAFQRQILYRLFTTTVRKQSANVSLLKWKNAALLMTQREFS